MADPSRHADSRNPLESLMRKVPGFRGYLEKEYRRESDQLARDQIVAELQRAKSALDQYQRSLVDAGKLDSLPQCERVRSRIDLLQSRVKGAMRGYSGFFDFVKVDEELLDQVYQHDLSLIEDARAVEISAQQLSTSADSATSVLPKLLDQTDHFGRRFDERSKLLEGNN